MVSSRENNGNWCGSYTGVASREVLQLTKTQFMFFNVKIPTLQHVQVVGIFTVPV